MGMGAAKDWSAISRFVSPADELVPDRAHARIYEEGYKAFRALYPAIVAFERKGTS
jgi:xylulokinase